MNIEQANINDSEEILSLQKLAYQSQAIIHGDFQIPPLTETLEELKDKFKTHLFLKAIVDSKIVGSIRATQKEGTCYLGRLMVHPDFQNQGIATKLLYEIERRFSTCSRFELFTGRRSEKNIRLYEKLGYKQYRDEQAYDNLNLVYLEKVKQPQ